MDQTQNSKKEHCKIAVIGNVDSGKSTLVGVLTKGAVDDGRGSAREVSILFINNNSYQKVFNFLHEQQNGRTSSIAQEIIGFKNGIQYLPDRFVQNKNKYWKEVVEHSNKVVTFLDLCGHEKYLRTTIFGMVAMVPDYSAIIIGSNMGISKMTREHLGISLFLKIPFIIVLTKIDIAPETVLNDVLETLKKLMRSSIIRKTPVMVKSDKDVEQWAKVMHGDTIVPIFTVSNVTGENLDLLKKFISLVPNRDSTNKAYETKDSPFQYDIQEHFQVTGVGTVVSGLIRAGAAKVGQHVLLGPDKIKQFKMVTIKSIHLNRVQVEEACIGDLACFSIKPSKAQDKLDRSDFRKGMVLIDPNIKIEPVREFEANVNVLHHPTTMSPGYQAVLHCGVIRQTVQIQKLSTKEILRTGDIDLVRFKFMFNSEFLKADQIIVIREGRTKIFGYITRIISDKELAEEKN